MQFLFCWVMKKKLCCLCSSALTSVVGSSLGPEPDGQLFYYWATPIVLMHLSPAPMWSQLVDIWPHGMTDIFCRSSVTWSVLTPIFPRQDLTLWPRIAWTHGCCDYRHESPPHLALPHFLLWTRKRLSQTFTRFDASWSWSHVLHSTPAPSSLILCLHCLWVNFYFTFIIDVTFIDNILYLLKRKIFTRVMMFIVKISRLCIFKYIFLEIYIHRYTWV